MNDWLSGYAADLMAQLDEPISVEIDDDRTDRLLDMARVVAHGTERKNAPLATFLAGFFVGSAVAQGSHINEALAKAVATGERLSS